MSLESVGKNSECHTHSPSTAKDWSPNVLLVIGTFSLVVDDDDL